MLVLVSSFFTFSGSSSVHACSCIAPKPPTEAMGEADSVFRGYAKSITQQAVDDLTPRGFLVEFEASEIWKGDLVTQYLVKTAQDSASCGFNFEEGNEYLVYTYLDEEGEHVTNLCLRTAAVADAEADFTELGQGEYVATLYDDPEPEQSEDEDVAEETKDENKLASDEVMMVLFGLVGLSILMSFVSVLIALMGRKTSA